jgi:FeS assembly SUF system regulator
MIRVSRLADYGVVLACHIAGHPGQCHNAYDLAEVTGLPAPTVSKLLAALAKTGILTSIRGAKGGYRLARDPAQITAADIVTAVDGPIALTICLEEGNVGACDVESLCPTRHGWHRLNEAIRAALASVPISELAPALPVRAPLPWPAADAVTAPATAPGLAKS